MPGSSAARRYAKALLGLAMQQGAHESIGVELTQVTEVLADPSLTRILALPNLPLKTRRELAAQLTANMPLQPMLSSFLRVLAENDRLNAVADIANAYQRLLERVLRRVQAQVRSAAPLSTEELTALVDAFSRLTQMTVIPIVEVNPDLLGGVVVEIEGRVYDASLKTQLERLGETFAQHI
jgi:F-type H+-transporting ATPase subunit delta